MRRIGVEILQGESQKRLAQGCEGCGIVSPFSSAGGMGPIPRLRSLHVWHRAGRRARVLGEALGHVDELAERVATPAVDHRAQRRLHAARTARVLCLACKDAQVFPPGRVALRPRTGRSQDTAHTLGT
eukprot:5850609-Pleurochrysis_carterae.AAC.2